MKIKMINMISNKWKNRNERRKNIISNYKDDDNKIYETKDFNSEIEELNDDIINNNKENFWKRKKRNENSK